MVVLSLEILVVTVTATDAVTLPCAVVLEDTVRIQHLGVPTHNARIALYGVRLALGLVLP